MRTIVRVCSRQDEHVVDEYLWPEARTVVLPSVGDEIATSRFGFRTVVRRHYIYTSRAKDGGGADLADLVVEIICE